MLRSSFTLIHKPINVANEQCGTVGLNSTRTMFILSLPASSTYDVDCNITSYFMIYLLLTSIPSSYTTFKSSSVFGFSGSFIVRITSESD